MPPAARATSPAQRSPHRAGDRYRIQQELARGGMGAVFRAIDEQTQHPIAVKRLIVGEHTDTATALFEREYQTLAQLRHPSIIEVFDYGVDALGPYYTMELLDGEDVSKLAPMPWRDACRHLRDVASSLALLHARRLLHRDLSPRNVRLTGDGRAKLLDFGAMAFFGAQSEVVGTPPCIAPEALRGAPLDQQADLYGLGALAYWLLTGKHAYPARRIEQLIDLWRQPPAPPSEVDPAIPAALDTLVLSLLDVQPMARPRSAAAVVDRLNGIADLVPENVEETAQSYLGSIVTIGRDRFVQAIRKRVARSLGGHGSALILEGNSGLGKTRLLDQLALEAQLAGARMLRVRATPGGGPYATSLMLLQELQRSAPTLARRLLPRVLGTLGHAMPALLAEFENIELEPISVSPGEQRAQIQHALFTLFTQLSEHAPLIIALDDMHHADEVSLAWLAALARVAKTRAIFIVATHCAGQRPAVASAGAVEAFETNSRRLKLRPWQRQDVEKLVRALFGDVQHVTRLASWLHARTGGIPLQCVELARYLVAQGSVRYTDAVWLLPETFDDAALPASFDAMLATRLAQLSPRARELAEALSIQTGTLDPGLCSMLLGHDASSMAELVDELTQADVLARDGVGYQFAIGALRELLQKGLDTQRRSAVHAAAGEALVLRLSETDDDARTLVAGWHLLHGGQRARGADLLMRGSVAMVQRGGSSHAEIPAMRAALEVYETEAGSDHKQALLLGALATAGYYVDYRLAFEFGDRAIAAYRGLTGLEQAERNARWLGSKVGLITGLLAAKRRHERRQTEATDPPTPFASTFVMLSGIVSAYAGVATMFLDVDRAEKALAAVDLLRGVRSQRPLALPRLMPEVMLAQTRGRYAEASRLCRNAIELVDDPRNYPDMEGRRRAVFLGGFLYILGLNASFDLTDETLRCAARLDASQLQIDHMVAARIRMAYHLHRGELEAAQVHRDQVELLAIQGGTTWQFEVILPLVVMAAYEHMDDVIGLKRAADQMSRRAEEVASLGPYAQVLQGMYLVASGRPEQACTLLEPAYAGLPESGRIMAGSCLAKAYGALGQFADVQRIAADLDGSRAQQRAPFQNLRLELELAWAEANLGEPRRALDRLQRQLTIFEAAGHPLGSAKLHGQCARIHALVRSPDRCAQHLASMEHWAATANNPFLISQHVQLAAQLAGPHNNASEHRDSSHAPQLRGERGTRGAAVSQCAGFEARAKTALERILCEAETHVGYLYLMGEAGLALVAASTATAPPTALERRAQDFATGWRDEHDDATQIVTLQAEASPAAEVQELLLPLLTYDQGRPIVVGAVALLRQKAPLVVPPYGLLETIAQSLYDAGDVVGA